jgi:hypothetical protein
MLLDDTTGVCAHSVTRSNETVYCTRSINDDLMNPILLSNTAQINTQENPTCLDRCVFHIQGTSTSIFLTLLAESLSGYLPEHVGSRALHVRDASSLIPQTSLAQSLSDYLPERVGSRALHVRDASSLIPPTLLVQSLLGFNDYERTLLVMRYDQLSLPLINVATPSVQNLSGYLPEHVGSRTLHVQDVSSLIPPTLLVQSVLRSNDYGRTLLVMRYDQLCPPLINIVVPGDIDKLVSYVAPDT